MNQNDFQQLADIRVKEAKIFLDNQYFEGAYSLLGYVVECALKSCISKQFKEQDFPYHQTIIDFNTHSFPKLLRIAALEQNMQNDWQILPKLQSNWITVTEWSEQVRYQHNITQVMAQELYDAVTENQTGILSWLKNFM